MWRHVGHVTNKIILIKLSPLSQDLWPLNLAGSWLQGGGPERKCISHHRVVVDVVVIIIII